MTSASLDRFGFRTFQKRQASEWILRLVSLIVLFVAVPAFYAFQYSVHQDLAGNLLSGKLVIELGVKYDNYSLYFPPVERIWFSLANQLHQLTGVRLDLVAILMTSAAILFSTELAYTIRKKTVGATPAFLIVSVLALTILPIVFKNVFGLREHMVVLGLWPYIVLRASDPDCSKVSTSLRLLVGVWVGFTLLFKYLYAIAVLMIELGDALFQRNLKVLLRPENLLSGSLVFLYLLFWLGLQPDNWIALDAMKSAIDANLKSNADSLVNAATALCVASAILIAARMSGAEIRLIIIGFALVSAMILVAWFQARWYSHHKFPILFSFIFCMWMLGPSLSKYIKLAVTVLLFTPVYDEFRSTASYQHRTAVLEESLAREDISLAGKRIGILSFHPSPYNQVISSENGMRWTPMMNIAYVASELKKLDTAENKGNTAPPVTAFSQGRELLHDQLLRLWEDLPPDMLILDKTFKWPFKNLVINWEYLLSKDERFQAIFKNYTPRYSHESRKLSYDVFIRKPD